MRSIDGFEIDCKTHMIRDKNKLNHAAVLKEIGRIADGEDVCIAESRDLRGRDRFR